MCARRFERGDRVRATEAAVARHVWSGPREFTVVGFSRDPAERCVNVVRVGRSRRSVQSVHEDFLERCGGR